MEYLLIISLWFIKQVVSRQKRFVIKLHNWTTGFIIILICETWNLTTMTMWFPISKLSLFVLCYTLISLFQAPPSFAIKQVRTLFNLIINGRSFATCTYWFSTNLIFVSLICLLKKKKKKKVLCGILGVTCSWPRSDNGWSWSCNWFSSWVSWIILGKVYIYTCNAV